MTSENSTGTILATIGTVLWCVQLVPQIIANFRIKNTEGFPESMSLLWCLCAPFFAVFMVSEDANIALMIQPHLFGFFCFIVYLQVMYYPPVSRSKKQIALRGGAFLLFQVCIEVGFIIPLRKLYKEGITWPSLVFGIIASIVLAIGLIPPYFELAKRKGRVIGINFVFLLMDFSGAVFSLASLAVDNKDLDIMGCIIYTICASLEFGIFLSHGIWWLRFRAFSSEKDLDLEAETNNSFEEDSEEENEEEEEEEAERINEGKMV